MQKVEFFKKEDFDQDYGSSGRCFIEFAAKVANEILNKYIESLPKVYFKYLGGSPFNLGPELNKEDDTHFGYLINIQGIEKKKCEHGVIEYRSSLSSPVATSGKCGLCGKILIAKWIEVES